MRAMLALASVDIVAAILLAATFALLSRRQGHSHLRRWTIAWGLMAFTQVITANELVGQPIPHVSPLGHLSAGVALLFLVAGTRAFAGQTYSHRWTVLVLISAGAAGGLEALGIDPIPASTPVVLALVAAIFSAALTLYRRGPGLLSHRLGATTLVLWCLNSATYPILGSVEAWRPVGMALSAIFQIATGIALLLSHLDLADEALDEAAERYRALIDHASVGVFRASASGRVEVANAQLAEILGHADVDALRSARDLGTLWPTGGEGASTAETSRDFVREVVWQRPSGQRRRLRIRGTLLHGAEGTLERVDGFVTDITEQRQQQEQLEASRRLQAVGRLTGGIAHDFNNLLTVIIGNLELARAGSYPAALSDALEASDRASKLTRQLLTFARSQEGESTVVDLVPQVTILSHLLGRTLPETVTLKVDHRHPECIAALPAGHLDQIVLNLVVNARDALGGDTGQIEVRTEVVEREGKRFALLVVADDGPGLDPSIADSLFEPFVSTHGTRQGLGLGLAIVHGLVEQAEGRIEVHSGEGRPSGTRFEVWLPAAMAESAAPLPPQVELEGSGTILVVDDDPTVRRTLCRIVEGAGFEVVEASGLREARAALDPELCAIITDVVMQDGSGLDVLESVESRGLDVPCILISGYPDQVTRYQASREVAVPILSKPFRAEELLALLAERIG